MAVATRFVPIELDRPRRLRFDPNAIADLEGVLGMGLGRILSDEVVGVRVIRAMLWAGLRWEDRGLTLERVGNILGDYVQGGGGLEHLGAKLREALDASGFVQVLEPGELPEGNSQGA